MRFFLALLCVFILFCQPTLAQEGRATCPSAEISNDSMGVRARDEEGNWRYITGSNTAWIEAVRFPRIPPLHAPILDEDSLWRTFGSCGEAYVALAPAFMGLPTRENGTWANGQIVQLSIMLGALPNVSFQRQDLQIASLYTAEGTDLLRYRNRLYAVHNAAPCSLAQPESMGMGGARRTIADPCTAEARPQLTGVVRNMADQLAALGVTDVRRSDIRFVAGKLIADLRVNTASGTQELHFAED